MEDQINIYDIAKMAGVSIATVSRVVNGSARVSQKTRDKVMAVIEGAGYTPNVFAQGLGLNTMHTVGILVPTIADMYMSSAVAYLEDALHNAGYDCLLSCSGFLADQKENHLRMMLSKRVDAMILVGSTYAGSDEETHNTDYIRVAAEKVPMFLINGLVDGENIYCTASNDYQASFDVTRAMVESGRDKILFLTDSRSYSANQKKKGYEDALESMGLAIRHTMEIHTRNSVTEVRNLLKNLKAGDFNGIFTTDDAMAVGAIKYAKDMGIRIPEKLVIVGYNDSNLCLVSEPELTSIDNRVEMVCRQTVERLVKVIRGDKLVARKNVVACRLIRRDTTDF